MWLVHIINSGRYTPKNVGSSGDRPRVMIEAETRKQFGEIRPKSLRRSERREAGLAPR